MHHTRTALPAAVLAAAVAASPGHAQQTVAIAGQVTATANGQPLAAVQVAIPSLGVGAQTRDDGRFTISVPARAVGTTVAVTARRIGYRSLTQNVTLRGGASPITLTLEAAATQLTGVVVSALGRLQEKATIGTSQQQLTAREINTTKDPNIVNSLSGKVAGVQINSGGNIGGSSRIVIRGNNSINGDNQPLFIVDGIPVSNANVTTATQAAGNGGFDYGNAIRDLNPDDIASLTVLKGPNAAALYGSRAANGAIVITTKSGRSAGRGISTSVNSYVTFESPLKLPTYQNSYAQGSTGEFQYVDGAGGGVQDGNDQSYGPRLDGRTTGCVLVRDAKGKIPKDASGNPVYNYDPTSACTQFNSNGLAAPLVAHPNNVSSFFNTGRTYDNNVAVSATTNSASARLSVGNQQQSGIVPASRLNRTTAVLNGEVRVSDQLTTTANVQYVRNQGFNRPGTGYNVGILEQFIWFGRQVDLSALQQQRYNPDGSLFNWNSNYHNNPYWLMYDNPNRDQRDRVIASGQANYKFVPWLTGTLRSGIDTYRENRENDYGGGNLAIGVDPNYAGGFSFYNRRESEFNTDAFLTATGSRGKIDFDVLAGGNVRRNQVNSDQTTTDGISVPGIYNVSNAAITPTLFQNLNRRGINSVYGQGSATFNKVWTVTVTGRNDRSSTLPKANNSYFYPSVSSSLVLSDLFPAIQRGGIDFVKLRSSVAQVGSDASPYQLQTTYGGQANKFGSLPQFTLSDTIANATLKPERTTSTEGGLEVGLFDNRLTLDATYYNRHTDNQIITLPISTTNGFANQAINAGRVTNKGFEALLTAIPVRVAGGLTWTSTVNFSLNRNKIVTLAPGLQSVVLGSAWSANIEARVGELFGSIVGNPYARDAQGNLLTSGGLPYADETRRVLGNYNPDWVGGWNNEFRYRRFVLSGLIDVRKGGNVFSVSNMFGNYTGVFANTLRGREVDWNNPGLVVKGVDAETGQPNTTTVTSEQYFQSLYGIHEAFVYDAGFVKLRELRLGYDLPQSLLNRARIRNANISFVGRNLLMRSKLPNFDPETALSTGNVQGLEFASIPTTRTLGFNITLTP